MSWRKDIDRILLPEKIWEEIVAHCRRKVAGEFLPGETEVNRAFGILAGVQAGRELHVRKVIPVKKNARNQEPLKSFMDKMMEEHAVPSTTPLSKRGWITDPQEFKACLDLCQKDGLSIFGAYHIHVMPWEGDPLRDTPTRLDTLLVKNSKMFSFIISLVDVEKPSMRAFYEGEIDQESSIIIV
ncbi:MAG: hypothetical protein Q3M24_08530 [Candidatus Electrothrix aestuarii]|uniref:JAB domain-containing protein n=1 Tax=Candidatus Electrothrix aestuarii TaxID=3062594 RepID=A0AAU8M0K9_9BACT|nr:hypothetical protein [Candidatus Electrothrix aestuarii]